MQIVFLALAVIIFLFGFVIFFGAPYVPTLSAQKMLALDGLGLRQGQKLYELGCGDGRILIEAAQRGWQSEGFELNPILALVAWYRSRRYDGLIKVHWSNFWKADLSDADGVFVFLLDKYMSKLDKKLTSTGKSLKLASVAFKIPGKKAAKASKGVFFYQY